MLKLLLDRYWDWYMTHIEGIPPLPEADPADRNYSWDLGGHGNWEEWSGY